MATFCSHCGTALIGGARFCHSCGTAAGTSKPPVSRTMFWVPTVIAAIAVVALIASRYSARDTSALDAMPGAPMRGSAPDLSSMSPDEQASRLFDRIMRLSGEGKNDSVQFFAPMAIGAIEAAGPLDNHRRYDMGMVALVSGNVSMASAQADTILRSRPTHLLGLALAARIADANRNPAVASSVRKKLVDAESSEMAASLPEYSLHENDVREAVRVAKGTK